MLPSIFYPNCFAFFCTKTKTSGHIQLCYHTKRMLANFKKPECRLCGRIVVGVMHMGCDAVHCSERCAREHLQEIKRKDPDMDNPGAWSSESSPPKLRRKPSLSCISEEALSDAESMTAPKPDTPDEDWESKHKHTSGPVIKLSAEARAVAGAILLIVVIACLGLI